MKKRNAEAQKVEESQRKFIPTCGVCDDGWVHLLTKGDGLASQRGQAP